MYILIMTLQQENYGCINLKFIVFRILIFAFTLHVKRFFLPHGVKSKLSIISFNTSLSVLFTAIRSCPKYDVIGDLLEHVREYFEPQGHSDHCHIRGLSRENEYGERKRKTANFKLGLKIQLLREWVKRKSELMTLRITDRMLYHSATGDL